MAFIIAFIPILGMAQDNAENRADNLKSSFRVSVSTQFLMQNSTANSSGSSASAIQDELFYQKPAIGLNAEWYGWSNIALITRMTYHGGSSSQIVAVTGRITMGNPNLYKDDYNFRLFLLEPGLKVTLPFRNYEVFWSGGPSFGFGSVGLVTEVTPLRYENNEPIPIHEESWEMNRKESSRNIGFSFSTGISVPVSSSVRLQGEIGYRNLNLDDFEFSAGQFRFKKLEYQLDSFIPTLGVTYTVW